MKSSSKVSAFGAHLIPVRWYHCVEKLGRPHSLKCISGLVNSLFGHKPVSIGNTPLGSCNLREIHIGLPPMLTSRMTQGPLLPNNSEIPVVQRSASRAPLFDSQASYTGNRY